MLNHILLLVVRETQPIWYIQFNGRAVYNYHLCVAVGHLIMTFKCYWCIFVTHSPWNIKRMKITSNRSHSYHLNHLSIMLSEIELPINIFVREKLLFIFRGNFFSIFASEGPIKKWNRKWFPSTKWNQNWFFFLLRTFQSAHATRAK